MNNYFKLNSEAAKVMCSRPDLTKSAKIHRDAGTFIYSHKL